MSPHHQYWLEPHTSILLGKTPFLPLFLYFSFYVVPYFASHTIILQLETYHFLLNISISIFHAKYVDFRWNFFLFFLYFWQRWLILLGTTQLSFQSFFRNFLLLPKKRHISNVANIRKQLKLLFICVPKNQNNGEGGKGLSRSKKTTKRQFFNIPLVTNCTGLQGEHSDSQISIDKKTFLDWSFSTNRQILKKF